MAETTREDADGGAIGTLGSADGKGFVGGTHGPAARGHWLGVVEGDLRLGGEFRARFVASGWEGNGHIEACEPPRRLLVRTRDADEPDEPDDLDGDRTILIWEERGLPVDLLAAYGAGIQIHVEDPAYLASGGERREAADARWEELLPAYRELAADADRS